MSVLPDPDSVRLRLRLRPLLPSTRGTVHLFDLACSPPFETRRTNKMIKRKRVIPLLDQTPLLARPQTGREDGDCRQNQNFSKFNVFNHMMFCTYPVFPIDEDLLLV